MATWSAKRRFGYFIFFALIVAILVGVPGYFFFYEKPTCFDGKMNGTETGSDCGGDCTKLCPADFTAPKIFWSYSMKIAPGLYNAFTYIQNPNQSVEVFSSPYIMKLYDSDGILIGERRGKTFIPANQKFAVFEEGAIDTGERVPVKTTLEFDTPPAWRPAEGLTDLRVADIVIEEGDKPKAEVKMRNIAIARTYSNIDAYIVLYDKDDNRVAFSKTLIHKIGSEESKSLYYTWPLAFTSKILRSEVLFMLRPTK